MDLYVLNKNFRTVALIDSYESFNWTDRYNEAGDFELVLLMSSEFLEVIEADFYLYYSGSEHLMIIEGLEVKTDDEKGDRFIVTGRSLESILERRIIWEKTKFNIAGSFQHAIIQLIINAMGTSNNNIGEWTDTPAATRRRVSNLVVNRVYTEPLASQLKMDATEYWGENLYDIVVDLCKSRDPEVGFKITWDQSSSNPANAFNFRLYTGSDRSFGNSGNLPPVSFSPNLENIFDTDFFESVKGYKTTVLIAGQYPKDTSKPDDDIQDRTTWVCRGANLDTYTGLYRREVFCDARNIPYKYKDANDNEHLYNWKTDVVPALQFEGKKELNTQSNKKAKTFEGEVDYQTTYEYDVDYKLGDIVDVSDIYGHEMKARIVEVTFSDDEVGFSINPTFEMFGEVISVDNS